MKYSIIFGNGSCQWLLDEHTLTIAEALIEIKPCSPRLKECIRKFKKGFTNAQLTFKLEEQGERDFMEEVSKVSQATQMLIGQSFNEWQSGTIKSAIEKIANEDELELYESILGNASHP